GGRPGRGTGEGRGVRVGDVVQLPLQPGVVQHDPGPDRRRYLPRGVRHMEDHRGVRGAGEVLEGRGCVGRHAVAPGARSVVHARITVARTTDNAGHGTAPAGRAAGRGGSLVARGARVSSGTPAPRSTWRTGA